MTAFEDSLQDQADTVHSAVCLVGFAFVRALWGERDLSAAWPLTDPLLRLCLTQAWLEPQAALCRASGFEPADVADAFTADHPEHDLWPVLQDVMLREVLPGYPDDLPQWGVTARHILVAPDIELLYLLPLPDEGDIVAVGAQGLPLLMKYTHGYGWRVLNFFSTNIPVPGWPPVLM